MTLAHDPAAFNHSTDEPLLVDINTACRKLDLSRPTVGKLVASGALKGVRCGRRHLVNYASLVAFSEGRAA